MPTSTDSKTKKAAAMLARAIKLRQRQLREEREDASARRKRAINLQLRRLDKVGSCIRMLGYGNMCIFRG